MKKLNVVVWDEFKYQGKEEAKRLYPNGIHAFIKSFLDVNEDMDVSIASLSDPDQGLPDERLEEVDVLLWWGHRAHDEVSDELIELILKLHPTVYSYSPSLISLHSDPEKAEEIYNAAWEGRPETTPAEKKTTSDVLGVKLYTDSANTAGATATQSSSSTSSGAGLFFALSAR